MPAVKEAWTYEVIREGEDTILRIDCEQLLRSPSIEDDPIYMAKTVDTLIEVGKVTKIVFYQKRDYEYDYDQTMMLKELAGVYAKLVNQKAMFSYDALNFGSKCSKYVNRWYTHMQNLVFRKMKEDPVGAYVDLRRRIRDERIGLQKVFDETEAYCRKKYISILMYVLNEIEKLRIILLAKPYLPGYKTSTRDVYREIFHPIIKPDFMFTKLMANYPANGEEIDNYSIGKGTEVTVFKFPNTVKYLYHLMPPEFKLSEEQYDLLDMARNIMAEHKPTRSEFVDPRRMRDVFYNVGRDLIEELINYRGIKMSGKEVDLLTRILVRYTVGFGLIEVLLQDEKIQDISVNSPMGRIPMFIVHGDYADCDTNIIPTLPEAESWASKLRMISGRPLDEANPILDTELRIPGADARVSVITEPLDPTGLAYSFRRHRDRPWTLPLFMKYKMINPLAAGILSFMVDGTRSMLIAGTRSSGKSSFLTGMMVEIMRRYRLITIEDTLELPTDSLRRLGFNIQPMKVASALVRGSSEMSASDGIRSTLRLGDSSLIVGEVRSSLKGSEEIVIVEDGLTKRISIRSLESKNLNLIFVPTLDDEQKMKLKKLTGFVKHPKRKHLIKLTTKTGREITVTPDHSVFTHVNFKIAAINTDQLKVGNPIIIPAKLPNGYNDVDHIDLLEIFKENYRLENAEDYIRKAISKLGWKKASGICGISDIYRYLLSTQKTRIPIKSFIKLMGKAGIKYSIDNLKVKRGTSKSIPAKFPINESILRLIGYYLAEGNINNGRIQITNSKPEIIKDITEICEKELGLGILKRKTKGFGTSVQIFISSKPLADLFMHLECGKTSLYKRIPGFVYGLNQRKICALLKGMYSGDGSFSSTKRSGNLLRYSSTSKKLVEDVAYALLSLGIVCRLHNRESPIKGYRRIYNAEVKQRKYIEFFLKNIGFTHKTPILSSKAFPHSKDDSVSFNREELEKHLKLARRYRHLRRTKRCSKDYLKKITEEVKCSDELYNFAHGDFFIDKVKSVELIKLKEEEHVYDLNVKSTQRFIGGFGGILLHNTEALALYEAMRVGAAANVVAGTIHGDSPYGVFDRVVNDIGVPKTSFKATDLIIVANPIKSADGIHRNRRVTQITEVRKHWENDPMLENGFVDLMKYDSKKDELVPSDDLINGESDVLKAIAANIPDFAGNWDALWSNVELRAKIKKTQVDYAIKVNDMELLEAPFTIACNDQMHLLSDKIKSETGFLDPKQIYFEWEMWLKRELKKRKVK